MLPDSDNGPAGHFKLTVGVCVALTVASDLRLPIPIVDPRLVAVVWAAVPEAAIDEHGHARTREDDIDGPAQPVKGPTMDEIAETKPMEGPTQG
jgi:hypothetical protein